MSALEIVGLIALVAIVLFACFSKGVSFDRHAWRGMFLWPREKDLFHFRITAGFVTVWVCKHCVHERLISMARMLGK